VSKIIDGVITAPGWVSYVKPVIYCGLFAQDSRDRAPLVDGESLVTPHSNCELHRGTII
jgi:hypothetical protein